MENAITAGNVRDVERILQIEGLETGPSAPPYLARAILWRPRSFRREFTPTDRQISRRNEITYKMVKLLVEHDADLNRAEERFHGNTPLMIAIYLRMQNVVQCLVKQGASTQAFNADSDTPLMYAVWFGGLETVQLLLDHNAKETINHVRHDGTTVLHWASCDEIVKLLLENGADPTIRNNAGQTPLEQAREKNWTGKVAVWEKYMNADGNRESETAPENFSEKQSDR